MCTLILDLKSLPIHCRGIPHLVKTPYFLPSSGAQANLLRLSLRESRTRGYNESCVVRKYRGFSQRDVRQTRVLWLRKFTRSLRLTLRVVGDFWCEFAEQEFTRQIIDRMSSHVEEAVADRQACSAITRGMVQV